MVASLATSGACHNSFDGLGPEDILVVAKYGVISSISEWVKEEFANDFRSQVNLFSGFRVALGGFCMQTDVPAESGPWR